MKINRATPDKHKYLSRLSTIAKPPEYIFFKGILPNEQRSTVAIVGTRKPTAYGKEVAHMLAYGLAKQGIVIVSGLALGIDSIAHRAALEAGGTTIAVLANSVDTVYPRTHAGLGKQILESGGAILSEYEPPTDPRDYRFLERNRIVSGLSDAIIIVEAAARSGTLSTAMHALDQGREVLVVPGAITSPLSSGCNQLIKQGALPITSVNDVLDVVTPHHTKTQTQLPLGSTPLETAVISLIYSGVRSGEDLQQATSASSAEFNQALTMLEINGSIRPLGGNQWSL